MTERAGLVWLKDRNADGLPVPDEGVAWDGTAPIGRVTRDGPALAGWGWRWSMFAGAGWVREPKVLPRAGSAYSKAQAKADCERAFRALITADPATRGLIHDHCAAIEHRARLWRTGTTSVAAVTERTSLCATVAGRFDRPDRNRADWPAELVCLN